MKRLFVHYCGWGEDWLLGELLDDGREVLFSWSAQALDKGIELSPLRLKLAPGTRGNFPAHQHHLPGLLADSLPDGWGLGRDPDPTALLVQEGLLPAERA